MSGDSSYNDVNYVFPTFVTTRLPIGLIGLVDVLQVRGQRLAHHAAHFHAALDAAEGAQPLQHPRPVGADELADDPRDVVAPGLHKLPDRRLRLNSNGRRLNASAVRSSDRDRLRSHYGGV